MRLSQQEQPHHCHGTGKIDDGRHICGLLVRAWYQALCQNAAGNVVARQSPAGTGAVCNPDRTCYFCLPRRCRIRAAGSRCPVTCWRPTCCGRSRRTRMRRRQAACASGLGHAECPDRCARSASCHWMAWNPAAAEEAGSWTPKLIARLTPRRRWPTDRGLIPVKAWRWPYLSSIRIAW
jgi:hypothetical protein